MHKILIIAPHFPPSNLASVHRTRLFAQHLPRYNWEPIILCVHEKYYEENLDWNLYKLLPTQLKIEKVHANKLTKPRLIGDIGLRAFIQLYKKAKEIIKTNEIDFIYIPIPSFYVALLGRLLHKKIGIKYGIDYIDPWVHNFPNSNKLFTRHWVSKKIANTLEKIAVKKASLITGVAEGYYTGVIQRNPSLVNTCTFAAMPYGGEIEDHKFVHKFNLQPYLFQKENEKINIVYAGAFLPKSKEPFEQICKAIAESKGLYQNIVFHFIGTGRKNNNVEEESILPIAKKYGIAETIIKEYPNRIPYLDVLVHLSIADGILILGSTEPHYTPSKSYQAVLSQKPILAVLHKQCYAIKILQTSNAAVVLSFDGESELEKIYNNFNNLVQEWLLFKKEYNINNINYSVFNSYSANEVTKILSVELNKVIGINLAESKS